MEPPENLPFDKPQSEAISTFIDSIFTFMNDQPTSPSIPFTKLKDFIVFSKVYEEANHRSLPIKAFLAAGEGKEEVASEHLKGIVKADFLKKPPSLEMLCVLFEMFDSDRSGDISATDLVNFSQNINRMKKAALEQKEAEAQGDIDLKMAEELIKTFDIHKKGSISPDVFLNIVLAAYEES